MARRLFRHLGDAARFLRSGPPPPQTSAPICTPPPILTAEEVQNAAEKALFLHQSTSGGRKGSNGGSWYRAAAKGVSESFTVAVAVSLMIACTEKKNALTLEQQRNLALQAENKFLRERCAAQEGTRDQRQQQSTTSWWSRLFA